MDTLEHHEDHKVELHMDEVKSLIAELGVDNKVVGKFRVLLKVGVGLELVDT